MKLDCVFYYVTNLDRAVEFYTNTLGLTLISRDVVARFRVDGLLLELVPTTDFSQCSGAGNARVTFDVTDIKEKVDALRRKGVVVGEIRRVANGLLVPFVDSEGNELLLWQYASAPTQPAAGAEGTRRSLR